MIKVSICTVTYNHGQYLAQAIESVLKQQRDFSIEMIIGEDCSTDNTREVLQQYAMRYPDIIKPIYQVTNVGSATNSYMCLSACTGEYIAALEGDDFWTDVHKLQRQVQFLDENPDFAISAHNLMVVNAAGESLNELLRPERTKLVYTLADLAARNKLATASCLYRNNFTAGPAPTGFPAFLGNVRVGDFCLHMLAARHGNIMYWPEAMGAYRIHGGGIWTRESSFNRWAMYFDAIHQLRPEFQGEINCLLMANQINCLQHMAGSDPKELRQYLLDYREQVDSLFQAEYPYAIWSLVQKVGLTEHTPTPNILSKVANRIRRMWATR